MKNQIGIVRIVKNILLPSLTGRGRGVGLLVAFLLAACSHIDEDERLIYVRPVDVQRAVLIEDFTGQRCVNCPNATTAIHELQQQYGEDNIIAVAIHSGPFAHRTTMTSAFISDLATTDGDDYFAHWGIEAQPGVKINRGSPIYDPSQFAAVVSTELQKTTSIDFDMIEAVADGGKLSVTIQPSIPSEDINARLQVWVVEDSINAAGGDRNYVQFMPDGSTSIDYVHNHVYRQSLTRDLYGDPYRHGALETNPDAISYECPIADAWNVSQLSVVVFLWNERDGVLQARRTKVTSATDNSSSF